jgi:hypothetical protein
MLPLFSQPKPCGMFLGNGGTIYPIAQRYIPDALRRSYFMHNVTLEVAQTVHLWRS